MNYEKARMILGMSRQDFCNKVLKINNTHYSRLLKGSVYNNESSLNSLKERMLNYGKTQILKDREKFLAIINEV